MRIQGWLGRSHRARSGGKEDLRPARCAPRAASRLGRREEGGGKAGGRHREASPHALLGLFEITLAVSKLLSELQGLPLQTAGKFWQQQAGLGPLSTRLLEKARNRNPSPFSFLP